MYIFMSLYLVLLLILDFFPVRLTMLPYGLHSNVTKLLANLYFIILPIVLCNLVRIKIIIIIIIYIYMKQRSNLYLFNIDLNSKRI